MARPVLSNSSTNPLARRNMMRKSLALLSILLVVGTLALPTSTYAQGCSMCRTALEQSPEGRAIAKSFDYAILFLMGIPYAMLGAAGIAIYRAFRSKARQAEIKSE
jgi:hypothetical protein